MYEKPQASVAECKLVLNAQDQYWKYYLEVSEQCSIPSGPYLGFWCNA